VKIRVGLKRMREQENLLLSKELARQVQSSW
jgi:hypothetical protein